MDKAKNWARLRRGAVRLRHQFAHSGNGVFAEVFSTEEIAQLAMAELPKGRDRHYSPLSTLRLFIEQVLSEDQACQDVVGRHLSERLTTGLAPCSLNTSAYCQARQRLPVSLPQGLCRLVGQRLEARTPAAWR